MFSNSQGRAWPRVRHGSSGGGANGKHRRSLVDPAVLHERITRHGAVSFVAVKGGIARENGPYGATKAGGEHVRVCLRQWSRKLKTAQCSMGRSRRRCRHGRARYSVCERSSSACANGAARRRLFPARGRGSLLFSDDASASFGFSRRGAGHVGRFPQGSCEAATLWCGVATCHAGRDSGRGACRLFLTRFRLSLPFVAEPLRGETLSHQGAAGLSRRTILSMASTKFLKICCEAATKPDRTC